MKTEEFSTEIVLISLGFPEACFVFSHPDMIDDVNDYVHKRHTRNFVEKYLK